MNAMTGKVFVVAAAMTLFGSPAIAQDMSQAKPEHPAGTHAKPAHAKPAEAKTVFTHNLPTLDGKRLAASVLEVTQLPGGSSAPHRHTCPVIGYVLEGALRMKVKGQEEKIYRPGDTFFESPSDVHEVSANASQDQPARFLAFFVCDHTDKLTVPATATDGAHAK